MSEDNIRQVPLPSLAGRVAPHKLDRAAIARGLVAKAVRLGEDWLWAGQVHGPAFGAAVQCEHRHRKKDQASACARRLRRRLMDEWLRGDR